MVTTVTTTRPRAREPQSNTRLTLDDLAARARGKYQRSNREWLECAGLMLHAREVAKHGEWLTFLKSAGIPQRTAARMIDFAKAGVQISHMADLSMNEIDAVIADARYVTVMGVENARQDKARMGYQLSADEISDGEWELAAAMVEYAVESKELATR